MTMRDCGQLDGLACLCLPVLAAVAGVVWTVWEAGQAQLRGGRRREEGGQAACTLPGCLPNQGQHEEMPFCRGVGQEEKPTLPIPGSCIQRELQEAAWAGASYANAQTERARRAPEKELYDADALLACCCCLLLRRRRREGAPCHTHLPLPHLALPTHY